MIIKHCKVHGPLTVDLCHVNKAGTTCKQCKADYGRRRRGEDPEAYRAKKRAWRKANLERERERDRNRDPEKVGTRNRSYYGRNRDRVKSNVKAYQLKTKIEVLTHYSKGTPRCSHCSEKDLRFLCLDHSDGGGKAHKREIGGAGGYVYLWARKNEFPPMFQVLCHNCNTRKFRSKSKTRPDSRYARLKMEVLTHYAGGIMSCVLCNEKDGVVLTIDHIHDNGAEHRRELGIKNTHQFYRWLRDSDYPEGFQTLCQNHNLGKRCLG